MANRPAKLLVLGLDAAIPKLVRQFAAEGLIPNLADLIDRGAISSVIPTFPPLTAAAWAGIVTGAGPGTAAIPSLMVHLPGEPLDEWHTSFDRRMLKAETLWEAAERVGKRTALINWPVTFPIGVENGIQIGASLNPPFRFFYMPLWDIASSSLFATEHYACNQIPGRAVIVEPVPAAEWDNLPRSQSPVLGFGILVPPTYVPGIQYHVALLDTAGDGYDQVIIAPTKDGDQAVARLRIGELSDWITESFSTDDGDRRGRFRFQLIDLAPDASHIRLYQTAINTAEPYTMPPELTEQVEAAAGTYMEVDDPWAYMDQWMPLEMYLDQLDLHVSWWVNATRFALTNSDWDLAFSWVGTVDHLQHVVWGGIDPKSSHYDPDKIEQWMAPLRQAYQSLDEGVGKILEAVDLDETLVLAVSDHGFAHIDWNPYLKHFLAEAGLLSFELDSDTGEMIIDWSRTKCFPLEPCHAHIFVNLKGRDPDGIVEPEDYAKVQEEIIDALYNMRDPVTGERVMALVLRKEEAQTVGIFSNQGFDRIGDVLFAPNPGYLANPFVYPVAVEYADGTKRYIPNPEGYEPAELGRHFTGIHIAPPAIEEMHSVMILAGPGVRHVDRHQPIDVTDIAPTLAYLLGTPIPKDAEGKILPDIPEDLAGLE